jgi:hypothetical protein
MIDLTRNDYRYVIEAEIAPNAALEQIARVNGWWTRSFTGSAHAAGDTFGVRFGETFVNFEVLEFVAGKRTAWRVTSCNLPWLTDTTEWTGTTVTFDVAREGTTTRVTMTHNGLTPAEECFDICRDGWDFYVGTSLQALLAGGAGQPDQRLRR